MGDEESLDKALADACVFPFWDCRETLNPGLQRHVAPRLQSLSTERCELLSSEDRSFAGIQKEDVHEHFSSGSSGYESENASAAHRDAVFKPCRLCVEAAWKTPDCDKRPEHDKS